MGQLSADANSSSSEMEEGSDAERLLSWTGLIKVLIGAVAKDAGISRQLSADANSSSSEMEEGSDAERRLSWTRLLKWIMRPLCYTRQLSADASSSSEHGSP